MTMGARLGSVLGLVVLSVLFLAGCGNRAIRVDLVPVEDRLRPMVVEEDEGAFVTDKVALINLSGLLSDVRAKSWLSQGENPVSDLRETLNAIERDPSVKAVVLRINSPGGTVTASEIMYRNLMEFKAKTHKPVVTCMMDVCASGGYYVSCASDYRIAYPSSITGSIGVIVQTVNFSGTLDKLGISAKAITTGPNKDVGSPLRPMTVNDEKMLRGLVMQFYGRFLEVVKAAPNHVKDEDWATLTDGRVVTGTDAAKYGLIDRTGDLTEAIRKAKEMAGIQRAKVIQYARTGESRGSIYAAGQPAQPQQVNMINVDASALSDTMAAGSPRFMYVWMGQ